MPQPRTATNVICLVKGAERYLFLYDDHPDSPDVLRQVIARMAADTELLFTWYDAAVVSQRIGKTPDEVREMPK